MCDHARVTEDSFELLETGLRTRAGTVHELAALSSRDVQSVRALLAELERRGYLAVDGDQVSYGDFRDALVEEVHARADDALAALGAMVAELTGLVDTLPRGVRAWDIGELGERAIGDVELFHGESAVTDLWHHLLGQRQLRRTDIVLPDASPLFVADPAMQETWHHVIGAEGNRARVVAALSDGTHPDAQARIGQELAAGLQLRLMPRPPSWFWVADGEIVALPLEWGESWPTTVVAIRNTAVAGLAGWAFERLWEQAVAARAEQAGWAEMLRLMTNGATVESAARALGISERTGRRRIAEAMDHFGAPNMLALGVAWGRRRRR
jgi:hypothetical protein